MVNERLGILQSDSNWYSKAAQDRRKTKVYDSSHDVDWN